ncbi:MAG: DUF4406 domain-containing protein [archaeon]
MVKIFISHPYSGDPNENLKKVDKICKSIAEKSGVIPISPLHLFSYFDEEDPKFRDEIMEVCFRLIDICDYVYVYGNSEGCMQEYKYALENDIPVVKFFDEYERKFLFNEKEFDEDDFDFCLTSKKIKQLYIINEENYEKRLRKVEDEDCCYLTWKNGYGGIRSEKTQPKPKDFYQKIKRLLEVKDIVKHRKSFYYVFDEGLTGNVAIDFFVNISCPPIVEIEFDNKKDYRNFSTIETPSWIGKEVTYDSQFKNSNIFNELNKI